HRQARAGGIADRGEDSRTPSRVDEMADQECGPVDRDPGHRERGRTFQLDSTTPRLHPRQPAASEGARGIATEGAGEAFRRGIRGLYSWRVGTSIDAGEAR